MERAEVKKLGDRIGYGRLFQLAQEEWKKYLVNTQRLPEDLAFAYGPCLGGTVDCICVETNTTSKCNWCYGSGWVTKKVRAVQEQESKTA